MPDRGDERGRGGTRTLVTGILAGAEWHPATNPQEATQTAREARDLAVRLRPVLSKLAQAPRGGRRRDLEWLPAVEQLAVDAQYFASWWLPRLEGKSAQSWPSWSADGYADWVKRLDAQRIRTLEMVQGTAPVARIASVTQLRRGKGTADAEPEAEQTPAPGVEDVPETQSAARHSREDSEAAQDRESRDEEPTARITPLRGPGAALMDAALMDMAAGAAASDVHGEESAPSRSADDADIAVISVTSAAAPVLSDTDVATASEGSTESTAPQTPQVVTTTTDAIPPSAEVALPPVPRTPPNQGPVADDPATTRVKRSPADARPLGFDEAASDAFATTEAGLPRVPRTPPNQGPVDDGGGVGADILRIPRTPPNSGPADAEPKRGRRSPVVSLLGDGGRPRVPRTPPNPGPAQDDLAGSDPAAAADTGSRHTSPAPSGPAALSTGAAAGAGALGAGVLGDEADERTRPLFRPDPPAPASTAPAAAAAAMAGAASGAGAFGSRTGSGSGSGSDGDSGHDEFENFQPGSDLPPPIFPMTEPTEPVDRGRIVRYALAAVVLAAACVSIFVVATQKSPAAKTAAAPAATSSSSSAVGTASGTSPSSVSSGAVTAPTATDTPAVSSTASKPVVTPPKSTPPPTSAPKTTSESRSPAAPPPSPPQSSHQPPPASGGVSSLNVSSLAPDQSGGYTYIAHVHVTTNGTGAVTVTVTFAGSTSSTSPGSIAAQSQSFTLSGKTSYDIAPELDVHGMCPSSPYIDAVASASGAGSAVAYASSPC